MMGFMDANESFYPQKFLKNAHVQTVLGTLRIRALSCRRWAEQSREIILTSSDGVRLQGFYSPLPSPKGLVILLHGWEGSAASTYMMTTGRYLYDQGFDIFRLNYRDHGQSHHLNPGIFFATNLKEVVDSVTHAAALANGRAVFLAGFSLGGNFALRIARQCAAAPIPKLRHVVAISPVLDPSRATDCIDRSPLYLGYFLKKWRRSLRQKQRLFPGRYDFGEALRAKNCREMTEILLLRQTDFKNPAHYFSGYTLTGDTLKDIPLPTSIITATDDPIIPADDFSRLALNGHTALIRHSHGGHNGFIEGLFSGTWYARHMVRLFDATRKHEEKGNG